MCKVFSREYHFRRVLQSDQVASVPENLKNGADLPIVLGAGNQDRIA
jgi:hypothetical protein